MDISTRIINKRFGKDDAYGAIAMPVYSNSAFEFDSAEAMEDAFMGRSGEHTYSRISNPTVTFFEQRVAEASGAKWVTATASGMAAIADTFVVAARAGANIVTGTHLFGNTFSLFMITLRDFGVEARFCDMTNPEEVSAAIDENTCAVFAELITNPHMEVADVEKLAAAAHTKNVPMIVDSTVVPWTVCKTGALGADIEVVSSTKYISGGATGIGGLILDHGTFDWSKSIKLKSLSEKFGQMAFSAKLRNEVFRNLGACMSPQTAAMQCLGLETLDLRYRRASAGASELAVFLQTLQGVKNVNYNGLPDNPYYEISRRQFGENPGAMLTFALRDRAECYAFMNRLQIIRRATNLFDNKSLIIHPLSTIYGPLSDEYKALVEVPDDMMRLSVGLEDVEDLKKDLAQAM
ncbi:MAG: aminotransferase class V-fold PLP-dependent enzyme [Prevotellaceae bacterium]|jgi:O-acetylhomoserine (thiol)-lyase|nr:aminotransferase class V-fold PLP-dependent enzyme [Prevotellaceae bacterium]